ncbi:MAG: archaetidylserine decarboxylase [Panacagrimonas sp.]
MAASGSTRDRLFALVQLCLPTRFISWVVFKLTRVEAVGFKNAFIRWFIGAFAVPMHEAESPHPEHYRHFNAFFTRALKPGARPVAAAGMVSPVDGTVSQLGRIEGGRIFQAKGQHYTAAELLGDEALARPFSGGSFCTIYLAPYNYHRIHMPVTGRLAEWLLVPGRLFSVNPATARAMPRLFARNERVVTLFETAFGPFALVLVGALNVGSMETVWAGQITPPHRRSGIVRWRPRAPVQIGRGEEMGRFNMGSTVVLLAPAGAVNWMSGIRAGSAIRMGARLADLTA